MNSHEDFSRDEGLKPSSDRVFGLVLTTHFLWIALLPLRGGGPPRWWSLALAGLCLVLALARPTVLHLPNLLWTRLALLLNKVVSPVVTGLLFYLVFTPAGILIRLKGKDPLRRRFESELKSYWVKRQPPGPPPEAMTQQF